MFAAFAEYVLMKASDDYAPFVETIQQKIFLAKVVIEFVSNNEVATYEDLLNKLQVFIIIYNERILSNSRIISSFIVPLMSEGS